MIYHTMKHEYKILIILNIIPAIAKIFFEDFNPISPVIIPGKPNITGVDIEVRIVAVASPIRLLIASHCHGYIKNASEGGDIITLRIPNTNEAIAFPFGSGFSCLSAEASAEED